MHIPPTVYSKQTLLIFSQCHLQVRGHPSIIPIWLSLRLYHWLCLTSPFHYKSSSSCYLPTAPQTNLTVLENEQPSFSDVLKSGSNIYLLKTGTQPSHCRFQAEMSLKNIKLPLFSTSELLNSNHFTSSQQQQMALSSKRNHNPILRPQALALLISSNSHTCSLVMETSGHFPIFFPLYSS